MAKKVEEKYKALSEVDHILLRPGMWIGSTNKETKATFIYDNGLDKMTMKEVTYIPALLKLFDEVLSNSCDEYRRKDNMGLNSIDIVVDRTDNSILIKDNGGIPVVKHKDAGCYVPEFIFGRLRTSSNYDDTEDRNFIGTNGVGSSLVNVFSKRFEVESADGKNMIDVVWTDNMGSKSNPVIQKCKSHYTSTRFNIDFDRFEEKGITDDFIAIMHKRAIDAAAANIGLKVSFYVVNEGDENPVKMSSNKFDKFEDYMELYSEFYDEDTVISLKDDKKQVWVCPDSNIDVAFVCGAECSRGTHLRAIRQAIGHAICDVLKKKHKIELTNKAIDGKYGIFGLFDVSNPSYSSQTKEELTTPVDLFYKDGSDFVISDEFINRISKSEIVDIVIDWYKKKSEAEDAAKIRKLNREAKKLLRSDKFINCNSKKKKDKQLWLYEGDSAKSGFRACRNSMTQACYCLRGKPRNTLGLSPTQIMKNNEFADIFNILGLQWGEKVDPETLNFGKIVICSDQDVDGHAIASLILVFFQNWPELFENGMIVRSLSPIIIATKGKDVKKFYSLDDFRSVQTKLKGYKILYNKGLGGLTNQFYKEMLNEPIFMKFTKDDLAEIMLKKWFSHDSDSAKIRKGMMKDKV